MQEINWGIFRAKFNGKEQSTFEWMCYLLFCHEFDKPKGIPRYTNHAGIETSPVNVNGEWVGWQAKFYDTPLSQHKSDFFSTIDTTKERHPEVTKLLIYTNRDFGQDKNKTDPKYKLEIDAHASNNNIVIEWRTASFFESSFVTQTNAVLAKHFFDLGKSVIDLVSDLEQHTKNVLYAIKSSIPFNQTHIKIDRSALKESLLTSLNTTTPIILSGDGGTGKTAVMKDVFDLVKEETPVLLFKAAEFGTLANINDIFRQFGDFYVSDFSVAFKDTPIKCLVIDSAEKLADIENREVCQEFLALLHQDNWKVLFTTRRSYLDDLRYWLKNLYGLNFETFDIDNLTREELEEISHANGFLLPTNPRLKELLRNPFYLREYLQHYNPQTNDITYTEFKAGLWDAHIVKTSFKQNNTHLKREQCFLAVALQRANEGRFFVSGHGLDDEILRRLTEDDILHFDSRAGGYFITHDIYEEWALDISIQRAYTQFTGAEGFFTTLGSSLPVRRAFRLWLSNALLTDKQSVASLVENTLINEAIPRYWHDEVLVSVLHSEHAKGCLDILENQILENNGQLLTRLILLLRTACKEVDESLLKQIGSQKSLIETYFTRPKGSGWNYLIEFIFWHKERMGTSNSGAILNLLGDWNNKHKAGVTTRYASLTALYYYEELASDTKYRYAARDLQECTIKVILDGSLEIKAELSSIIDAIASKGRLAHGDKYHDITEMILGDCIKSFQVACAIPASVIQLAKVAWEPTCRERDPRHYSINHDFDFGLISTDMDHFPASAYQTPMWTLLRFAPRQAIDFFLWLTNKSVECYANSQLYREVLKVEVYLAPTDTKRQYLSTRLWEMYRGFHPSVNLLQSLHMALEKGLIAYGESTSKNEMEGICLHLLSNSDSASVSAIVASIVIAYPDKLFNVAKILFKTREFFIYDRHRLIQEHNHKSLLLQLKNGMPGFVAKQYLDQERIDACDERHRKSCLERLAVSYQFFKSEDVTESEANERLEIMYSIWDFHYDQLPQEEVQSVEDKTWRIYLARMDRRKQTVEVAEDYSSIIFTPNLEPDIKAISEEAMASVSESTKYMSFWLWAKQRWEWKTEEYQKYEQYELNSHLVIETTKELLEELNTRSVRALDFMMHSLPAYACAVLLRDFAEKLDDKGWDFCKQVILHFASYPLQEGYDYQISDGVQPAIITLPLLWSEDNETNAPIKYLLMMHLLNRTSVGHSEMLCDIAISAIGHHLWGYHPHDAHSLFLGFLLLRPIYDALLSEIRHENYKKGIHEVCRAKVFEALTEKHEEILESILSNAVDSSQTPDLQTLDLDALRVALLLLPDEGRNADHEAFLATALPIFAKELLKKDREQDRYSYLLPLQVFHKLASMVLHSSHETIESYMKPFLDGFKICDNMKTFFECFIIKEYQLKCHEAFWEVWKLFYAKIIDACTSGHASQSLSNVVTTYLLAGSISKEGVSEWDTLQAKDSAFFKQVAQDIGFHQDVLYSLSKLLNGIGSAYIDSGIDWLCGILEKHNEVWQEQANSNTIFYMECLIRKFVLNNRHNIKTTISRRQKILVILDFLIQQGSVTGYLIREDIL